LNRTQPSPSPWPSLDLATVQIEMNRLTEAEAILREAIHFDSRLPQAHYQLGRVLEKEGKLPEATETLKTAAALDPAYPDPHFLLGRIYHRTGQAKLGDSEIQQFQQLQKQASDATAAKPMATR
jgi:tetratricopeptide (TPR) repeat protein